MINDWILDQEKDRQLWSDVENWQKKQEEKSAEFAKYSRAVSLVLGEGKGVSKLIDSYAQYSKGEIGTPKLIWRVLSTGATWRAIGNLGVLRKIGMNSSDPDMQRALIANTTFLDLVAKKKESINEILDDMVTQESFKQVASGVLDILEDEKSKEKLKEELLYNYFKSSLPSANKSASMSFDKDVFKKEYVEYEKKSLSTANDLKQVIERRLKKRLEIQIKALERGETLDEKTQILKNELVYLGVENSSQIAQDIAHKDISEVKKFLNECYNKKIEEEKSLDPNITPEQIQTKLAEELGKEADQKCDLEAQYNMRNFIEDYTRYQIEQKGRGNENIEDLQQEGLSAFLGVQNRGAFIENYIESGRKPSIGNLYGLLRKSENALRKEAEERYDKGYAAGTTPPADFMRLGENVMNIVAEQKKRGGFSKDIDLEVLSQDAIRLTTSTGMSAMLDNFGITADVINLIPEVGRSPDKIAGLIHSIRTKGLFQWAEDVVDLIQGNPGLAKKIISHPEIGGGVAKGVINQVPSLKNLCEDFGCADKVLDIISELMKDPGSAKDILNDMNNGRYTGLVEKVFERLEKKDIGAELSDYLSSSKQDYLTLSKAVLSKLGMTETLKKQFGLDDKELNILLDVVSPLLSKPGHLPKIYNAVQENDYIKLMECINAAVKENEDLQGYLKNNSQTLGHIVEKIVENSPANDLVRRYMGAMDISVADLTSAILENKNLLGTDNFGTLLESLKYVSSGKKEEAEDAIMTLSMAAKNIVQDEKLNPMLEKIIGKNGLSVVGKLLEFSQSNPELMADVIKKVREGNIAEITQHQDFQKLFTFLKDNSQEIGGFVNHMVYHIPDLKSFKVANLGEINVGEQIEGLLRSAESLGKGLEAMSDIGRSASGKTTMATKAMLNLMMWVAKHPLSSIAAGKDTIGVGMNLGKQYFAKRSSVNSEAVSVILNTKGLQTKSTKLSSLLEGAAEENTELSKQIKEKVLHGLELKNKNFDNITVDSFVFVNNAFEDMKFSVIENSTFIKNEFAKVSFTELFNVDFKNSKFVGEVLNLSNTKLTNVNFSDIKLEGVKTIDLSGAKIDDKTFKSLIGVLRNNSVEIDFSGAKIKGDLSRMNLIDVNLTGADLSDVTSMKGTDVLRTSFDGAIIPKELLNDAIGVEGAFFSPSNQVNRSPEERFSALVDELFKALDIEVDKSALMQSLDGLSQKSQDYLANKMESALVSKKEGFGVGDVFENLQGNVSFEAQDSAYQLQQYFMSQEIADGIADKKGLDSEKIKELVNHLKSVFSNLDKSDCQKLFDDLIKSEKTSEKEFNESHPLINELLSAFQEENVYTPDAILKNYVTALQLSEAQEVSGAELKTFFVQNLSQELGERLFSSGAKGKRQEDVEIVRNHLSGIFDSLTESQQKSICEGLITQEESGVYFNAEHPIIDQLYKNCYSVSNYTTMGLATGGIYLKKESLDTNMAKDSALLTLYASVEAALDLDEEKPDMLKRVEQIVKVADSKKPHEMEIYSAAEELFLNDAKIHKETGDASPTQEGWIKKINSHPLKDILDKFLAGQIKTEDLSKSLSSVLAPRRQL